MRVLLETSEPVTNIELFHLIGKELKKLQDGDSEEETATRILSKDEIRNRTNLTNLYNYFVDSRVNAWQSSEACSRCLDELNERFGLKQFDLLQVRVYIFANSHSGAGDEHGSTIPPGTRAKHRISRIAF
eukprot:Gregarina_sp_Poly_1__2873@NODE_1800_length_3305_cov_220_969426_g1170_i0_p4_GENE_NODE_1800_length_3305_cov_220_969426_g1170_i0NODE_1800_length_3305_cov_220_969426_g1170_i0_p4_ORF_typecomplete_len130_score18_04RNA_pol_Rpb4/PF03874_16/0_013Imm70/PF15601_6/0_023_NODE_1800_length_3305_cov_220_969426_g1170_i012461635